MNINYNQLKELLKYALCGAITTAVNLGIFYALTECGVYYLLSNIIGYYIAVVINFYLNKRYVFNRSVSSNDSGRFWKFVELRTLSLIVDSALFFVLVSICGFHVYLCRIALSMVFILANYLWSKYKIFRNA